MRRLGPVAVRSATGVLATAVVAALLTFQARQEPVDTAPAVGARGDAGRTGTVSSLALGPPTRIRWTARTAPFDRPQPRVAIAPTGVVVDDDGVLTGHDPATGAVRWSRPTGPATLPPLTVGPSVVRATATTFEAVDPETGAVRWRIPFASERGRPTAATTDPGGFIAHWGNAIVALSPDGEERWRILTYAYFDASLWDVVTVPTAPGRIFLLLTRPAGLDPSVNDGVRASVAAFDLTTGRVRWDARLPGPAPVPPLGRLVALRDRIVVTGERSWTIDARTGDFARVPRAAAFGRDAVALADDVLQVDTDGRLVRVDPGSGRPRWRTRLGPSAEVLAVGEAGVLARVAEAADASGPGRLVLVDPRDGSVRRALEALVSGPSPSVATAASGTVVGSDGRVIAVDAGGEIAWDVAAARPATSDLVVGEHVYLATGGGVAALDPADGRTRWVHEVGQARHGPDSPYNEGTPVLAPEPVGVVVTPTTTGIVALDARLGVRRWDRTGDAPVPTGPLTVSGDTVFLPVADELHGYDVATGRRSFAAVADAPRGPIAAVGEVLVAAARPAPDSDDRVDGPTLAVRRSDRTAVWRADTASCTPPAGVGGTVVVVGRDAVTAVDATDGRPRWAVPTPRSPCLAPAVGDGTVVVVSGPRTVTGIDLVGGEVRWRARLPGAAAAAPTLAGPTVLVPVLTGAVQALDLGDGGRRWRADLPGVPASSVAVHDGGIIVRLRDGTVVAYD